MDGVYLFMTKVYIFKSRELVSNPDFTWSVTLQKNGYPPHYVEVGGARFVRRGNKREGHYYEYWP